MGSGMTGCWRVRPNMLLSQRLHWAFLLGLFMGLNSAAQFRPAYPPTQPAPPSGQADAPLFSAKVNLARLLVSVRDRQGAIITNLNKEDFRVIDSGVEQQVAIFERNTSIPLSVAILMDTSASTKVDLHYETGSVLRFISALLGAGNPEDTFALFTFNWHTNLEVDYSRNKSRASKALNAAQGEGGTSLYDAIFLAGDTLQGRPGRHVIVVVTDGGDTTSYKKYNDALRAAQIADAVMYPIVVVPIAGDAGRNLGGEHALATLAASTGGRIFNPSGFAELDEAFANIIHELRTQYLIGFYPKDVKEEPRRFHPVSVTVGPPGMRTIARSGYYEP
jgi:Ca-activated chloride channel family protein